MSTLTFILLAITIPALILGLLALLPQLVRYIHLIRWAMGIVGAVNLGIALVEIWTRGLTAGRGLMVVMGMLFMVQAIFFLRPAPQTEPGESDQNPGAR